MRAAGVSMSGAPDGPLLSALAETGAIGSTVLQLADRVSLPPSRVEESLESLKSVGRVVRMGRGLWVLADFETLEDREDFVDPAEFVERFVHDGGPTLGLYSGPITFSENDERPIHRWWPYVQGYSAEFVAGLVQRTGVPARGTVLDPFAGSGTTLVEARRAGLRAVGFEILPPAALAARVKTRLSSTPTNWAGSPPDCFPEPVVAAPALSLSFERHASSSTQGPSGT